MSDKESQQPFARFTKFVRSFGPRASEELFQNLLDHLELDSQAVDLVATMVRGETDHDIAASRLTEIEHGGDQLRTKFVDILARTLVTPLDREDLYRFSRAVDDLLDELRDFVREWKLLVDVPADPLLHVLTELAQALSSTSHLIESLSHTESLSSELLVEALRRAIRVRRVHEDEITLLFEGEITMTMLRTRELLHRLDSIGVHLVTGLNIVADSLVKRGE